MSHPHILHKDIVAGKFRQVIVSPEIATSLAFRKSTLSKPAFTSRLRCVCIDEAHCISLWGGRRQNIKREVTRYNTPEENKGRCRPIVEVVVGPDPLLRHSERKVQIVPDNHEQALVRELSNLCQSFLSELVDFSQGTSI